MFLKSSTFAQLTTAAAITVASVSSAFAADGDIVDAVVGAGSFTTLVHSVYSRSIL